MESGDQYAWLRRMVLDLCTGRTASSVQLNPEQGSYLWEIKSQERC